jgi:hypothetical protein
MLRIPHCLDSRLTVNCEILATCSSTYSPVRTSLEAHSVLPHWALGFTQPLTEMSTRSRKIMFLGSRERPVHRADDPSAIYRFTPEEISRCPSWIRVWLGFRIGLDEVKKRKFLTLPELELRPLYCPTSK